MNVLFRTDASGQIGGGHMMRCLAIARALRDAGHRVAFVMARLQPDWAQAVKKDGFQLYPVSPAACEPDPDGPNHQHWLSAPWSDDAAATGRAIQDFAADWLIWDHYGLDARWVNAVRQCSNVRCVMAVDDLDDRALGSDFVLDQTRLDRTHRVHPALASLSGPEFATLRPEFAELRPSSMDQCDVGLPGAHVLVTLGLADSAALVPTIADVLARIEGVSADIVMGQHAQTLPAVAAICARYPHLVLHIDTPDMAALMRRADLCIGAGGMTSWERCSLGLGTLLVPVAENQQQVAEALERAGAAQVLPLRLARDPKQIRAAVDRALVAAPDMARAAYALCDGKGTARVIDILSGGLRPVTADDAHLLFEWRNQPHIRAASLNTVPLDWNAHIAWVNTAAKQQHGAWWVYSEGGRPLGHVNARPSQGGVWRWGFYIGAPDAPKGAGQRMLARALGALFARTDCLAIEAEVRADNPRSVALHHRLGFQQTQQRDDGAILVFSVRECEMNSTFAIRFPKEPHQ